MALVTASRPIMVDDGHDAGDGHVATAGGHKAGGWYVTKV